MLIAAASGRALAASAARGGYLPLVADMFGDQDTLAASAGHVRVDLRRPIAGDKLIRALEGLAAQHDCAGIVCGSGFEDRADLLACLARRWPLLGNNAETVARIKDPIEFAALCRAAKIPHPETSLVAPADPERWLVKRVGGAGGWHVRSAKGARAGSKGAYFQRRVTGEPVSALLLGDGHRVMVLGFSTQWASPLPRHPFRYGGAVRPAPLVAEAVQAMTAAIERLNAAMPLSGLNSADFLVDGDTFRLLEVNPRPGATFDLFEPEGASLFALHVEACAGRLPVQALRFEGAMAGAIVYADHAIAAAPEFQWPDWTADRPVPGSHIDADQPLCSVFARAETARQARRLVEQRGAQVQAMMGASVS